jgi:hypothetical protein
VLWAGRKVLRWSKGIHVAGATQPRQHTPTHACTCSPPPKDATLEEVYASHNSLTGTLPNVIPEGSPLRALYFIGRGGPQAPSLTGGSRARMWQPSTRRFVAACRLPAASLFVAERGSRRAAHMRCITSRAPVQRIHVTGTHSLQSVLPAVTRGTHAPLSINFSIKVWPGITSHP